MIEADALTSEQRAVVHHRDGPAAVLAVPGAGKTTAVAHRVRVLVEERNVRPGRILVSSFNRDTIRELTARLEALDVRGVEARTLHGLGHLILRRSGELKEEESSPSPRTAAYRLARRALRDLAGARDRHPRDLDVTVEALVDQVAAWKQELAYLTPSEAPVPAGARDVLRTATHANDDLVALFRRFEHHRRTTGWWTYADLLRDGWAALVREEALRTRMQDAYGHVLVDEFQDVGRAQYRLLDRVTAPDRNYMVVGDDDQSIYRWRGGDPSYLREFATRYNGDEYWMEESFRLPAAPLVLANAVIGENDDRRAKRIHLTQGFDGEATLLREADAAAGADRIAEEIDRLRSRTDKTLADMVVLVRTYGQTPPIEQALLDLDIPYQIRGHRPFYRRRPAQTILQYLYWAVLERRRREQEGFDDPRSARRYAERFSRIINRPNRFVERSRADRIARQSRDTGRSVLALLDEQRPRMPDDTAERVDDFRRLATRLVARLGKPAAETLGDLIDALEYETVLRDRSTTAVRGEMQVQTVRALRRFARNYATTPALLHAVRALARRYQASSSTPSLDLRSIHRAKGAEWPVVFVPDCNEGVLPLASEPRETLDVEEERRLFYVALTRTQRQLVLGVRGDRSASRFLEEAEADRRLAQCTRVRDALRHDPDCLSDRSCARLCQAVTALRLDRYIERWWTPDPIHAAALLRRLSTFAAAITAARERRDAYEQERADHHERLDALEDTVESELEDVRRQLGATALPATLDTDAHLPRDACLRFETAPEDARPTVLFDNRVVGRVDPFSTALDAGALLDLPWSDLVARLERVVRGQEKIRFTIDWPRTKRQTLERRRTELSAPDPPSETTRLLAREEVRKGYETLHARLSAVTEGDVP
jgi:DNA helicase-2/ATP-dependent DNA helicase PcrA